MSRKNLNRMFPPSEVEMNQVRFWSIRAGFCVFLMVLAGSFALAFPQGNDAKSDASAGTSTSTQTPIAEVDAIAYDNLRNNAQQIYNAVKLANRSASSFVIYDRQLFSQLPMYRPAVNEVDQLRQQLCTASTLTPGKHNPETEPLSSVPKTLGLDLSGAGTLFSGIASLLAVFKPSLSVTSIELPRADQELVADFASVAAKDHGSVFLPGVVMPTLEPDDRFQSDPCPTTNGYPEPGLKEEASLVQEWRAAGKVADKVSNMLEKADPATDYGKALKGTMDSYTGLLKKYTTTDQSGNSPLASLLAVGHLETLLRKEKPLIVVLGVDDVGGTGWVKGKAFTIPVTYSGGSSSHFYIFGADPDSEDSKVIASGTVTSFNTQLDSKSLNQGALSNDLERSRIVLPSPPK